MNTSAAVSGCSRRDLVFSDGIEKMDGAVAALERARLAESTATQETIVYSRYRFAAPLAHGVSAPSACGFRTPILRQRTDLGRAFSRTGRRGGRRADAHPPRSPWGHRFSDARPKANPLDYVEGGLLAGPSPAALGVAGFDQPEPDQVRARGGKMIVTIGTDDTLASPGAQLDYFQSLVDTMGRARLDGFARLFVMPQAGHGLSGRSYGVDGEGKAIPVVPIPNTFNKLRCSRTGSSARRRQEWLSW